MLKIYKNCLRPSRSVEDLQDVEDLQKVLRSSILQDVFKEIQGVYRGLMFKVVGRVWFSSSVEDLQKC